MNVGSGGGAAAPTAGGAGTGDEPVDDKPKPDEKEEGMNFPRAMCVLDVHANLLTAKEESDDDMGFGLFD